LMINRGLRRFSIEILGTSRDVLIVSPWPAFVPVTYMPLPFRSTFTSPPAVLDTARSRVSVLPPAAKEPKSYSLCP